jgi:hypothetical protein
MKTTNLYATLASLLIVFFMSVSSIANPLDRFSGDLTKSSEKKNLISNTGGTAFSTEEEMEFSYLRFDVENFVSNTGNEEVPENSLDYLRFDVSDHSTTTGSEISDLPSVNEFDYLRFDVNKFTESSIDESIELPVDELSYLRFDVSQYTANTAGTIDELPLTE